MIDIAQTEPFPAARDEVAPEDLAQLQEQLAAPEASELLEEQADGSVIIYEEEQERPAQESKFGENLVRRLPSGTVANIGSELLDLVKSDRKARELRDKQYAEGIKRTGLGNDAPGGADFPGASKVVHPMLAKACVDFASRAAKELLPANGPVKTQIVGRVDSKSLAKAERKKKYMNWQLTQKVRENSAEFEQMLSQLPLGGSQYKRWWREGKRLRTEAVFIDDVFLPYDQGDFYTSPRVTHMQRISRDTYAARIDSGLYAADGVPDDLNPEQSDASKASDKVIGQSEDAAYIDGGLRTMYMIYAQLEVEDDKHTGGASAPYIIHLDEHAGGVKGLYRNWAEGDEERTPLQWMVEYTFIPWRGGRGIGLAHLIGGLSAAATGSLRALLDSALFQNFPGALKLKAGRTAGNNTQVSPTELTEIQAPPGVDDIRKLVMAFPFPGPSNVLYTLLEWLTGQGESVVTVASEKMAEAGPNTPVGTTLAMIEHGSVNFSAIHTRLHAALARELEIVHRLNAEVLTEEEVVEALGSLTVYPQDFQGPMDVAPVSDPNIFSEAQRYAQLQAVLQLYSNPQFAGMFKPDRLLQRALRLLQIPGIEDIANVPKDSEELPALRENFVAASADPQPLKVYESQNDLAHLQAHLQFMTSPMFGGSPLMAGKVLPTMIEHCKEHMLAMYAKHTTAAADVMTYVAEAQGLDLTEDELQTKAAAFADHILSTLLGPMVMPALEQAMKTAQQFGPKPPVTPDVQAKLANDLQIENIRQQGQMRADEVKRDIERMIVVTDAQQAEKDRQANERAALIAERIQALDRVSEERMVHFRSMVETALSQEREASAQQRDQFQAAMKERLVLLEAAIANQLQPLLPPPDAVPTQQLVEQTFGSLAERMEAQEARNVAALQALADGLAAMTKLIRAPRSAEYVRDPATNKVLSARSRIVEEEEPPQ